MSELEPRESMEFDVVIVGGGPSGLSAAIRLKQINPELEIVVLEKGAEIGAHILSGAVVDPAGIDALIPNWREEEGHPFQVPVRKDRFLVLGPAGSITLPVFTMPPLMNNHGNYIVSLGNMCRWLGEKAESMEVQIFPGFAASEILYDDKGAVIGVATGDMGLKADGTPGPNFERGVELLGKYVLFSEGARGSLAKQLIAKYALDKDCEPAKFGIGIKELWEIDPAKHNEGMVQHSFGWPLDMKTGGGSFLYHMENNQVAVGFVVHLNYRNPYLSPFEEFQRFKTHLAIAPLFEGAKRISYGARVITEGGWQSVPKLTFPGGALIGCSAGLLNVPRIKGSHNAVLSGMEAAEAVAAALKEGRARDELSTYDQGWRKGPIGKDLKKVRNSKPLWSKLGTFWGIIAGGVDMWITTIFRGWSPLGTLKHGKTDAESTWPAAKCKPIAYPKPDGILTFDRNSSVFLSNTHHAEDEPVHLHLADPDLQETSELHKFAGPSTRYCPAGVYEWVDGEGNTIAPEDMATAKDAKYIINAQNCVHCKTCDIKDPNANITWVPPQGGEGPVYPNM